MGVDSGLPDFRGTHGFWQAYPPFARLGLSFIDLANPTWFDRDPAMAWGFYGHRLNLYRRTSPHPGFSVLQRWGEAAGHGAFVFTSNVDGHFQVAGFPPERVVECHGSIHHLQCCVPCHDGIWSADGETVVVDNSTVRATSDLPACPRCNRLARPNVLMFGDWSWVAGRTSEQENRLGRGSGGSPAPAWWWWSWAPAAGSDRAHDLGAAGRTPRRNPHPHQPARAAGAVRPDQPGLRRAGRPPGDRGPTCRTRVSGHPRAAKSFSCQRSACRSATPPASCAVTGGRGS